MNKGFQETPGIPPPNPIHDFLLAVRGNAVRFCAQFSGDFLFSFQTWNPKLCLSLFFGFWQRALGDYGVGGGGWYFGGNPSSLRHQNPATRALSFLALCFLFFPFLALFPAIILREPCFLHPLFFCLFSLGFGVHLWPSCDSGLFFSLVSVLASDFLADFRRLYIFMERCFLGSGVSLPDFGGNSW